MPPDLRVDIAPGHKTGLALQNPVLTASGTFSWGLEFERHFELQRLGGMVSKGITVEPRAGNKQPRVAQTPAGMLNSIGLQNIGVRAVVDDMAPIWAGWKIPSSLTSQETPSTSSANSPRGSMASPESLRSN